jgi:hypothetical protein
MWNVKTKVIPITTGATANASKIIQKILKQRSMKP